MFDVPSRLQTAARAWRRLDRPWAAVLVTGLLVLLFVGVRATTNVGSLEGFVVAGDGVVDAASGLPRVPGTGYDGQFIWQLSQDPLTHDAHAFGVRTDTAAYRQQRVALPAVVWALHEVTGISHALLLVAVNVLALLGTAWAGALLARHFGRHAMWGVALALSPGLVLALARDLNEPLSALGLLAGLYLWCRGRPALATLPFLLAVLARETTLSVLAGLGLWAVWSAVRHRDLRRVRPALWLLVPLAVATGWQLHLQQVWGVLPFRANEGNLSTPLVGFLPSVLRLGGAANPVVQELFRAERVVLLGMLVGLLVLLRRSRVPADLRAGFVLACLLAFGLTSWRADVQFLRGANEALLLGLVVAMGLPALPRRLVLTGSLLLSAAVFGLHAVVA
jgi:hypothetical protein